MIASRRDEKGPICAEAAIPNPPARDDGLDEESKSELDVGSGLPSFDLSVRDELLEESGDDFEDFGGSVAGGGG